MRILFATDGRKPAADAAALIEKVARRDRTSVGVLAVLQTEIFAPDPPGFVLGSLDERRDLAHRVMEFAVTGFDGAGFATTGLVREGHPGEEIVRAAADERADLVVMGGGSHSWLNNFLLGSASSHVLHRSPVSVLIVHELGTPHERARVLFGTDGSAGAGAALDALVALVDPGGCTIEVVSVAASLPPPLIPTPEGIAYFRSMADDDVRAERALRDRSERYVADALTRLRGWGFDSSGFVAKGYPGEQLLKEAESGEFDLVAVGSRGIGPMRRAFLGSVSDHVARLSRAALIGRRPA